MRTFILAAVANATLSMQSNAVLVALTLLLLTTRGVTVFLMHPPKRRLRR
jgi:hypothetical protein